MQIPCKFYDKSVIATASEADNHLMSPHAADTREHVVEDSVCEISATELEQARRDPQMIALLHEADRYVAELDRQGRNL
jgi:hypothetical protein